MFIKFGIILLIIIFIPIQLFAAGLKKGEPVKIYVIDTGYKNGMGLPKDAVHLHDTGSFTDGMARGNKDHGTDMTKIYYDKLKDKIKSGEVELHSINITDKNGKLNDNQVIEAMEIAKAGGANIVNMSFGTSRTDYMSERILGAINNLTQDGAIVVKAAGNEGNIIEGGKFIENQANNHSLISVGALDSENDNNTIQDYSSGQKTGMVDVYATSVTKHGGTSSATAYTGATIAKEFLEGNISERYDKDKDGTIDVFEARSFISSPDISDKDNIIGADKAQYKVLVGMGYKYDKENGDFYLPGKNGEKQNTISALVLHELENDEMIEYKVKGFEKEKEVNYDQKTKDRYNTYVKMGRNLAVFRNSSIMDMNGYYSQFLYLRGVELRKNDWVYDSNNGEYIHWKKVSGKWEKTGLSMTVGHVKTLDKVLFNRFLRIGELLQAGYKFEKVGIVDKNGKTYPVEYMDDYRNYLKLLYDVGVDTRNSFVSTQSVDKDSLAIKNQDETNEDKLQKNDGQPNNSTVTENHQDKNVVKNVAVQNNKKDVNTSKLSNEKYGLGFNRGVGGNSSIAGILGAIIKILLSFVGGMSVLVIVGAGIIYITSAGDDGRLTIAKRWILYAIIGLVISLLGWVIVNVVIKGLG